MYMNPHIVLHVPKKNIFTYFNCNERDLNTTNKSLKMSIGLSIYLISVSLILLFAVVSNFLVIGIVAFYRKLRTVTHVLICNLAVSDILLAVVYMPQKLHDMTHPQHYHEGIGLCKFIHAFPIFVINISCYTLVFISFERRRAIMESNRVQMKLVNVLKLIPVIWISSILVASPTIFEYSVYYVTPPNSMENSTAVCGHLAVSPVLTVLNCLFVVMMSFVIPLILMFKNYAKLILFVNKRCSRVTAIARNKTNTDRQVTADFRNIPVAGFHLNKNRMKIIKMLVVMAVTFVICWLPFFLLYVYTKLVGEDASVYADGNATLILTFLMAFSTAYNVILYVIFNSAFREALKNTAFCSCEQINDGSRISAISAALETNGRRTKLTDVN